MESTSSPPSREAKATDHPLLLAVARQRKNLEDSWAPALLFHLPVNLEKCQEHFQGMGGLQRSEEDSVLQITPEDMKIFSLVADEIEKYPVLARNLKMAEKFPS
jgi:hypothetical protein